jgi:hypothetical protein
LSSASTPTRTEMSGASAATFLVLLLLLGGVDSGSAEAFGRTHVWTTGGVLHAEVAGSVDREVQVERRQGESASGTEARRFATQRVLPARWLATAMLPRPRAPDDDRVL